MSQDVKTYIVKDEIQNQITNMLVDMQDVPADMPSKVSLGHEDYYLLCKQTFESRVHYTEVLLYGRVLGLEIVKTDKSYQCSVE